MTDITRLPTANAARRYDTPFGVHEFTVRQMHGSRFEMWESVDGETTHNHGAGLARAEYRDIIARRLRAIRLGLRKLAEMA